MYHDDWKVDLQRLGPAEHPALHDLHLLFPTETFTSVLGNSGCGKSVLLAFLAGRIDQHSFTHESEVTVQLRHVASTSSTQMTLEPRDLQLIAAYVPPEDVVFGFDTPREAIIFRHRLYFGSTHEEAAAAAQKLLDAFGLSACADNLIAPGVGLRGISGGQRRRTCIAMALSIQPKLLLLDEPTTGLDSYTSKSIVELLQKTARDHKCVVIAALQQPGSDLFQFMDRVVMMSDDGGERYVGDVRGAPGVVVRATNTESAAAANVSAGEPIKEETAVVPMGDPEAPRVASLPMKLMLVMDRHMRALRRNPVGLGMRVAQTAAIAIFFGLCFYSTDFTPSNFKQVLGFLITVAMASFAPVQTAAAVFPLEKDVFLEEQALAFRYPAFVYALSKTITEGAVAIPLGVIYAVIVGAVVGLPWDVIGRLCITAALLTAASEGAGFFISTVAPPSLSLPVIAPVGSFFMMVVGTSLASPTGGTAGLFTFFRDIAFIRNAFAAAALDVIPLVTGNCTSICYYENAQQAMSALHLDNITQGEQWGLLVMWFVVFRGAGAIALTVMGWDRRIEYEQRLRAPPTQAEEAEEEDEAELEAEVEAEARAPMGQTPLADATRKVMYTPTPGRLSIRWSVNFRVKPYFGKEPWRTILQPMEGTASAGRCLAIMGGSGAGKSTLMEALSLQLPPTNFYTRTDRRCVIEAIDEKGEVMTPMGAKSRALIALVYQDPLFIEGMTVREVTKFAVMQHHDPDSPYTEDEVVDALLESLAMGHAADVKATTLSVSQKKRLAVCEALALRRPIVMLDEPTSGLDSVAARLLLRMLSTLAHDYGVCIMYTLHQPGDDLLPFIDDLLLLSAGRVVYQGPLEEAKGHFAAFPKPEGLNDTDHYLELSSSKAISATLTEQWLEKHPLERTVGAGPEEEAREAKRDKEFGDGPGEAAYLAPVTGVSRPAIGFVALAQRAFSVSTVKPPTRSLVIRFIATYVFIPLIVGISQYGLGSNLIELQNGAFMIGVNLAFTSTLMPIIEVNGDLNVLLRDQAASKYHPLAYYFGRWVASTPIDLLGVLSTGLITYFMMELENNGGAFMEYLAILWVLQQAGAGLGYFLGVSIHSLLVSAAMGTVYQMMMGTGCGVIVSPSRIDTTGWLHVVEFLSAMRQAMLAILHNEMRFIPGAETVYKEVLEFSNTYDDLAVVWVMLVGLAVLYRVLGGFALMRFTRPRSY